MQNNEIPFAERPIGFRQDETIKNQTSNRPLQAMLNLPDEDIDREKLNGEQSKNAKAALYSNAKVKAFPRSSSSNVDPPIQRQNFALVSFIPAKGAKPDREGVYGLVKVRGVFNTENEAEKMGEKIIRDVDSINEIDVVNVGQYFPCMKNNEAFVETTREIDIRHKVIDENQNHVQQKRADEEKQKRDLNDRRQKLLDKDHTEEQNMSDKNHIDYFIALKQKRAEAKVLIDDAQIAIAKAEKSVESSDKEIKEILEAHPEFQEEYLARYQNAKKAVGINPELDKLARYME